MKEKEEAEEDEEGEEEEEDMKEKEEGEEVEEEEGRRGTRGRRGIYNTEVFPTKVGTLAVGFVSAVTRIGSVISHLMSSISYMESIYNMNFIVVLC